MEISLKHNDSYKTNIEEARVNLDAFVDKKAEGSVQNNSTIIGTEFIMEDTTNDSVSYDADEDSQGSNDSDCEIIEFDDENSIISSTTLQTQSFEGTERSSELLSDESVDDRKYDSYIGKEVAKIFSGKIFQGIVQSYDNEREYFMIKYEDSDSEEMDFDQLRAATRLFEEQRESSLTQLSLRKYTNSKSLRQPSTSFMTSLGRCREERDVFRYVVIDFLVCTYQCIF